MLIAGAGGHALEVFDVLLNLNYPKDTIFFFDDVTDQQEILGRVVIKSITEVENFFTSNNKEFCLGVGSPASREILYNKLLLVGGKHISIISPTAFVSNSCLNEGADIMPFSFVSSGTKLGVGTLINTRSNIHHEVFVGDFTEISPSCNLLGQAKVGKYCRIGANTTILPGKELSDKVISGAGSVVTRNYESDCKIKGVPAEKY